MLDVACIPTSRSGLQAPRIEALLGFYDEINGLCIEFFEEYGFSKNITEAQQLQYDIAMRIAKLGEKYLPFTEKID